MSFLFDDVMCKFVCSLWFFFFPPFLAQILVFRYRICTGISFGTFKTRTYNAVKVCFFKKVITLGLVTLEANLEHKSKNIKFEMRMDLPSTC